jgi:murein DD-endopeptidase MepM/ murein hydrolase activator NlpD
MTTGGSGVKDKKAFFKRFGDFLAGKGFYVVLFVCVAVIGVSAWILLFTGGPAKPETNSIASPIASSEGVMDTSNLNPDDAAALDALGKKPVVTPTPSATPKSSTTPKPGASPNSGGKANTGEGKAASAMAKQPVFIWPVMGDIAVMYSQNELMYNETMGDWRTHNGIDISAPIGAKVMAASDGKVSDVATDDLFGTTVVIDHGNGLKSVYANLAKTPVVVKGDKVASGSVIGAVGDTALGETNVVSHLHFSITKDNLPADPALYLPKK